MHAGGIDVHRGGIPLAVSGGVRDFDVVHGHVVVGVDGAHAAHEADRGVAAAIGGDVVAPGDEIAVGTGTGDPAELGPARAAVAAGLNGDVFAGLETDAL